MFVNSNCIKQMLGQKEIEEVSSNHKGLQERLDLKSNTQFLKIFEIQALKNSIVYKVVIRGHTWYICLYLYKIRRFPFLEFFRKSSASKTAQNGTQQLPRTSTSLASGNEVGKNLEGALENEESLMPMIMPNSFIDAKVLCSERLICCIVLPSIHLPFMCGIYLPKNYMLYVLHPFST